jgi:hypothetical protein
MPGALNFNPDLNTDVVLTNTPAKQDDTKQHMPALPISVASIFAPLNVTGHPSPLAPRWRVPGWLAKLRQSRTPGSGPLPAPTTTK